MARNENPPFELGQTYFGGGTVDTTSGTHLEGMEWVFNDRNPNGDDRTNRYKRCRIVRNTSGINLLPKRLARFERDSSAPNEWGRRVDGYATTTAAEGYPIDEYLPAAGVPNNDLFWITVEGPAVVLTDLAAAAGNVITSGDWVVALTAATSQATTAGRIALQDLTGATALLANQVQNRVGRALSAATTNNTGADLLIEVGHW